MGGNIARARLNELLTEDWDDEYEEEEKEEEANTSQHFAFLCALCALNCGSLEGSEWNSRTVPNSVGLSMPLPLLRLLFSVHACLTTVHSKSLAIQIVLLVFDSRIRTYGVWAREFVEHNLCMIPGRISSTSTSKRMKSRYNDKRAQNSSCNCEFVSFCILLVFSFSC